MTVLGHFSSVVLNFFVVDPTTVADIFTQPNLIKLPMALITETWLKISIRNTNIDLSDYSYEYTSTEANCSGALHYIDNKIYYIARNKLCIHRKQELGSFFFFIKFEITQCIYWHSCMYSTKIKLLSQITTHSRTTMKTFFKMVKYQVA